MAPVTRRLLCLCLITIACHGEPAAPPVATGDTVITHRLPGDWTMRVDGRTACATGGRPRTYTEADFLTLCGMLGSIP